MDYTKYFLQKSKERTRAKFDVVSFDNKIKTALDILRDIKKTLFILQNFMRIEFKIDIDEHIAYFLKDKNDFINVMQEFVEKSGRTINRFERINYLTILEILKARIDVVLKEYKSVKQKILKKINKKENFWKIKDEFISKYSTNKPRRRQVTLIENSANKYEYFTESQNNPQTEINYTEAPSTMNIFKESESKDLDKTKQILFQLSDLVKTFSEKVVEQQQITHNSKPHS
jgi:hypothetical protein